MPVPQEQPAVQTQPGQSTGQVNPGLMQILHDLTSRVGKAFTSAGKQQESSPAPGYVSPGRVGGAPQPLAGTPTGVPGIATTGQAPIASSSARAPGTPMPQNEFVGMPGPSTPGGFEFGTRQGRNAATVTGVIENLTKVVNTYKQREAQKTERRAEVLTRSLYDALGRGDEGTINDILSDAKNVKILEKAGIGVPPEIKKVEPPSAEQKGVQKAVQWAIGAKATPQSQAQQIQGQADITKSQGNQLVQQQRLEDLQKSPEARRLESMGTTLTPEELKQHERWLAGFEMNPVMRESFTSDMRMKDRDLSMNMAKLVGDMNQFRETLAFQKLSFGVGASQQQQQFGKTLEETKRMNNAQVAHWDILANLEKERLNVEKARASGTDANEIFKAYSAMVEGYSAQLVNLRTQMTELLKTPYGSEEEKGNLLSIYRKTEQDIMSSVDNAKSLVELHTANKEWQKIMEEVTGGKKVVEEPKTEKKE